MQSLVCIEAIKLNLCREDGCSWRLICSYLQPGWGLLELPFAGSFGSGCHWPALPKADVYHTQRYPKKTRVLSPFSALTALCASCLPKVTALWCRRLERAPARRLDMPSPIPCASTLPEESFTPSYRETGTILVSEVLGRQFIEKNRFKC